MNLRSKSERQPRARSGFRRPRLAVLGLAVLVSAGKPAGAAIDITGVAGLHNTAVNQSDQLMFDGTAEVNYTIVGHPLPAPYASAVTPVVVVNAFYPMNGGGGPWVANDTKSKWIAPSWNANTAGTHGYYTYQTTFRLSAAYNPKTASLAGKWSSDNDGVEILLNGVAQWAGHTGEQAYLSLHDFAIGSGFVMGENTLGFRFWDGYGTDGKRTRPGAYSGLRVTDLRLEATPVPELSTWFTGAGALAILLCFAWSVHSRGSGVIRVGDSQMP